MNGRDDPGSSVGNHHRTDVRLVAHSSWTFAQRCKNDVLYLAARALFAVLPLVSPRALQASTSALATLAPWIFPRARRIAERNLTMVFPALSSHERRALLRQSLRHLGGWLADALAAASGRPAAILPFAGDGERVLRSALAEERGVLLVSAHLGPWEQIATSLVGHGINFVAVSRGAYDPRLDFVFERLRGGAGVKTIARGTEGSTARIVRTLRRGVALGVLMDLSTRARSVESAFLGRPVRTAIGPARLALASGAAVLVVTAGPVPGMSATDGVELGGLALHVERVCVEGLSSGPFPAGSPGRQLAAVRLTRRLDAILGERVRGFPDGWVWMHERFAEAR